jgi:hypothetical protein
MPGNPRQPDPLADVAELAMRSRKFLKNLIENPEYARTLFDLSDEDMNRLRQALAGRLGDTSPPANWDAGQAAPWRFNWGLAPWRFYDPNK